MILTKHVALFDESGVLQQFGPGDTPPEWACKRITNPAVWDQPAKAAQVVDGPPPRAGKGSGEDKWRAYAESVGVDVSAAEGRDDIIAALQEAGVPVE